MLPMTFQRELEFVRRIAAEAGELALRNRTQGFSQETKSDLSPVTTADRANEQLISARIEEAFPEDGILGEEGAVRESHSGRRWIVDPIDGTRDFVRDIPTWGVLIGLEADGEVVAGACNLAAVGQLYSAAKGGGAYCNGARIGISSITTASQSLVCLTAFSSMHKQPFAGGLIPWMGQFWAVRSLGGCMDAIAVCSGRAEAWIEGEVKPWDLAALKIIAQEAGAKFFNFDGRSSIYGGNCVITVPALEAEIRKFLGCA